MPRNIEVKTAVTDLDAVRRRASALASGPPQVIHQIDTFFVVATGRLKVRQFADGTGELIAYERPDRPGPSTSCYSIVPCGNATALVEILARIAPLRGRVVKRRELILIGQTRVHLDNVESLGCFVELEVVLKDSQKTEEGERVAVELMQRLGIDSASLVSGAYIDLLDQRATIPPR